MGAFKDSISMIDVTDETDIKLFKKFDGVSIFLSKNEDGKYDTLRQIDDSTCRIECRDLTKYEEVLNSFSLGRKLSAFT